MLQIGYLENQNRHGHMVVVAMVQKDVGGLTATARGASLQYRKGEWNGGMKVTAVFCPDKDTGEGFGSANGQFVELFLKYDAKSRTGYGLRIERLPQQANGCAFSLRHYENGKKIIV